MFGTFERFNLVRGGFARAGSNTFIGEDFHKPGMLRLGNNWARNSINDSDYLFDIKLLVNGAPVKYTYFADAGSIILKGSGANCCAEVEFALTDRSHFRVRGENAGLRLELRSASGNGAKACRGIYALPGGCGWEAEFGSFGKLFFKALCGNYNVTSLFDDEKNQYSLVRIDFIPECNSGGFEAAIHDYRDKLIPFDEYECFDDLVCNNRAEFDEFRKRTYTEPAPGYEDTTKYAQWIVWSNYTLAIGNFAQPHILYLNTWGNVAAPWQQSYNAMAMLGDPLEAWRLICVMFLYQDERTGRVPSMMTYSSPMMGGMQPAFQGFALEYLLRKIDYEFISIEEAERMYPKFAAWSNYWTTYRNAGLGDDVIEVLSTHESGWDDSSLFQDGFPAIDPCALTFEVLMMECTAKLAEISDNYKVEAAGWMARADKLTKTIIKDYWDGEKFFSVVKGKKVDSLSLANYQPIILGKRLSQNIIDKVAEKLTQEDHWLTDIGLASESMLSARATFGISFVCGRVVGPMNVILTVGLQAAGKQKEADMIARRFCDHVNREGIILGYAPYNYYKYNGEKADQQIPPHPADGWPVSPWTACSYLAMVTGVIGK